MGERAETGPKCMDCYHPMVKKITRFDWICKTPQESILFLYVCICDNLSVSGNAGFTPIFLVPDFWTQQKKCVQESLMSQLCFASSSSFSRAGPGNESRELDGIICFLWPETVSGCEI